ncbi:helix-turn-helix transcriptional regulator [Chitinispirillales bacterium ANBcel5]|uniref:helix-turn-helix domain-containing protein n=1 Tax=Cellulosispirillum alkaliphilum TaxID=3039283 RepID=UPI002A556CFC|nr:helix-turn-helix transcriptional regulator [Chitinispirillales bacterium ANBcel5]
MFSNRDELLAQFNSPVYRDHPDLPGLSTFCCLQSWQDKPVIELSRVKIEIHSMDYLVYNGSPAKANSYFPLKFQQNCYRLWYQTEGFGILQNVTNSSFGTARPGLLGIMDRGERHSYLHQRGNFQCFQILFSLHPSNQAKCFWNSEIEGKINLEGNEKAYFENLIFDLMLVLSKGKEMLGLATISRILEILVVLFKKGLLLIEENQFPKNKAKSLVAMARNFMKSNYASMEHQQELERECAVDINYLNILFKKETGLTLYQYMISVRIEHAKHLLETTTIPIVDIAYKVGYPNCNSFTRVFKKHTGITPQNYRICGGIKTPPKGTLPTSNTLQTSEQL